LGLIVAPRLGIIEALMAGKPDYRLILVEDDCAHFIKNIFWEVQFI
jgi:hypothetical protein